MAKSIGVFAHPSLVIFRQYGKEPIIYAGDLKNEDSILVSFSAYYFYDNCPKKLECFVVL